VTMGRLTVNLLGPYEVDLDGDQIRDFTTEKARALLAYVAVEANRAHRRDFLAGLLWPEQPQQKARRNLRQALSHLRQAIRDEENAFLLISRETVQLNPDSDCWLDVAAFADLMALSHNHRHRSVETCRPCMERLETAVALYRGEFLRQFFVGDSAAFEEWTLLKREWLHRLAVDALFYLADYYERRGEYDAARRYAWRQVEMEPWREEAHRQLMRVLALSGQRSAAIAQYQICQRTLAEELGVEPTPTTTALCQRIREGELAPVATTGAHLPAPSTPFVGREQELAQLAQLLADPECRLLALVGPGGIGKTRLALQAAREQIGCFRHGIHFIPFGAVRSADLILPAVATAVGLAFHEGEDPRISLLNYLRQKEMLLVLDNMEHLLAGVSILAEMLRQAPGVVLLVTSRERLNLREEWVFQVEGLAYPQRGTAVEGGQGKALEGCSAVDLFVQSAQRVRRDLPRSDSEMQAIVEICRLVAGVPLALELAAAWVTVRSCEEIAREIERNLDVLSSNFRDVPPRHQSMRATFEHSWALLSAEEQRVFARLSVFRGGFGQVAATTVTDASPPMLLTLSDKSLIRQVAPNRYEMHELLSQYASEKLQSDPPHHQQMVERHTEFFCAFLAAQQGRLTATAPQEVFPDMVLDLENIRLAWQMAVSDGKATKLEEGLESLYHFCAYQYRLQEGVELLGQIVNRWEGDAAHEMLVARALARQGALYRRLDQYHQAQAALERAYETFRSRGVEREQLFCLIHLASTMRSAAKYAEAEALAQQALSLAQRIADVEGRARALLLLGMVHVRTGKVDAAERFIRKSLQVARESGNKRLIVPPLNVLGDIVSYRGDYTQARALFDECLVLDRALGDQFSIAMHLNNLGTLLHVEGQYNDARPFYEESLQICHQIGDRKGKSIALSNLGEIACELGDYEWAAASFQQALSIGREIEDQRTVVICLNNLGQIALALEDWTAASTYLADALQITSGIRAVSILFKILVNASVWLIHAEQTGEAAEVLGLVLEHPGAEQETKQLAQQLLEEQRLVPQTGDPASLEAVVAAVLALLAPRTKKI
jgi:predicted ATPase/DNA-binding SARP family transcriptional activator/Tfp pilus assembly protein PilF